MIFVVLLVQVTANGIELEETMYKSLESRSTNHRHHVCVFSISLSPRMIFSVALALPVVINHMSIR